MTRLDTGEIDRVFTMYEAISPRISPTSQFFIFRGKYTTSTIATWLVGDYLQARLPTHDALACSTFSSVAIRRHDPIAFNASSV